MNEETISILITARDAASRAFKKVENSAASLRTQFKRTRDDSDHLQRSMSGFGASFRSLEADFESVESKVGKFRKSFHSTTESIQNNFRKLKSASTDFRNGFRGLESDTNRASESLHRIGVRARSISDDMTRARQSMRDFGVSGLALLSLSPILTILVQLSAQLLSVAYSAGVAAGALGAGLVAAAGQAVPVIGLLAVSLKGVMNTLNAVKAANNQAAKSSASVSDAADKQAKAEQRVKDAQERVIEAQKKLTDARKEARRELEDMVLAQKRAELASQKANLSIEQTQASLRNARISGDLTGAAESSIDLKSAKLDIKETRTTERRGKADLAGALNAGVEGSDRVLAARKELADATRDLAEAQREAAKSSLSMAAGSDALATAMAKLSPAEKRLFAAIMSLQASVKRAMAGVKSNIIDGFTFAVGQAQKAVENIRIQKALNKLSLVMRDGIKTISRVFAGSEGQKIFAGLTEAAAKNLPHLTKAFANLSLAIGRLAMAGRPFVEWMVKGFERWSEKIEKGSRNTARLENFFVRGQKHLKAWINLLSGVADLFLAIGSSGGAASGLKTVTDMGNALHRTADNIRESKKESKSFWATVNTLNAATAKTFRAIGKLMLDTFKGSGAQSMAAFADVLSTVLVPALNNTLKVTSTFTSAVLKFLNLPVIKDLAKWGATFIGIAFTIGKFIKLIEFLVVVIRTLVAQLGILRIAIASNPVIAIIAGLAIAVLLLDKRFHFLRPTIEAIGDAFKKAFGWVAKHVGPALSKAAHAVVVAAKAIGHAFSVIGSAIIKSPIGTALKFIIGLFIKFYAVPAKILYDLLKITVKVITSIAKWIGGGPIGDAIVWIIKQFKKLYNAIADFLGDAYKVEKRIITKIANWIVDGPIGDVVRWWIRAWRRVYHAVADFLGDAWSVVKRIGRRIVNAFHNVWDDVKSGVSSTFKWILKRLDGFWDKFASVVKGAAGKVKDAFKFVAGGIKDIFTSVFEAIYNIVRKIINGIANGAGKIANLPGIKKLTGGGIPKDPMPAFDKAFASGGVIKARPGGIVAKMGEAGYDEVVLTTDPKHASNTARLLGRFLAKTGVKPDYEFAKGGYVQGAQPPGQPTARLLANMMFARGYNVTSAHDGKHAPSSYHYAGGGEALDFGDSVNNLGSLWKILFPLRSIFAELFGPAGLYKSGHKISSPALQAQHDNHIHVATAGLSVKALTSGFGGIIKGLGNLLKGSGVSSAFKWIGNAIKNFGSWVKKFIGDDPAKEEKAGPFRGMLSTVWGAYRKRIKESLKEADSTSMDSSEGFAGGGTPSKNLVLGKKIMLASGFNANQWPALRRLWDGESGWNQSAKNASSGAYGIPQALPGTKMAAAGPDWRTNPVTQIKWGLGYIRERYGTPSRALSFWNAQSPHWYADGGELPGSEGQAIPVVAHAGEMILNRAQQMMLGGPGKLRKMFGFNPRSGHFADGGEVGLSSSDRRSATKYVKKIDDPIQQFNSLISDMSSSLMKAITGRKGMKAILKIVRQLTSDDGPVAQLLDSLEQMRSKFEAFVKNKTFAGSAAESSTDDAEKLDSLNKKILKESSKRKPSKRRLARLRRQRDRLTAPTEVTKTLDDTQTAELGMVELEREGSLLSSSRNKTQDDLSLIEKQIRAEKGKGKKANKSKLSKLKASQKALENSLSSLDSAIADNVEARYNQQRTIIDAQVASAQNSADKRGAAIDLKKRIANTLGNISSIPSLIDDQISSVQSEITDLKTALATAQKFGDTEMADKIQAQIDDLSTSITELTTEKLSTAIDVVNQSASNKLSLIDIQQRVASISNLGQANYTTLGSLLTDKGSVLESQKSSLTKLLSDAISAGNTTLTDSLTQSIADLDASILENTLAIEQNTVAALQQKIDATNKSANFLAGVSDTSSSIIKAIGDMMGETDTSYLYDLATSKGNTLVSQGSSLKSYLNDFLGGTLDSSFTSLSGKDLVEAVNTIVNNTDLSGMIQEQVDQFYSLVDAILQNEAAVQENTAAIEDLEGAMKEQTFTTSAWEKFRQAVFNGSGGLLSSYDIPQMASGGFIQKEGLFHLHAGEKVTPASMVNNDSNTNIHVNINEAGGYPDPNAIGKIIGWELSSRGRS